MKLLLTPFLLSHVGINIVTAFVVIVPHQCHYRRLRLSSSASSQEVDKKVRDKGDGYYDQDGFFPSGDDERESRVFEYAPISSSSPTNSNPFTFRKSSPDIDVYYSGGSENDITSSSSNPAQEEQPQAEINLPAESNAGTSSSLADKSPDDIVRPNREFHYGPPNPRSPAPVKGSKKQNEDESSSDTDSSKDILEGEDGKSISLQDTNNKSPDDLVRSSRNFHYGPTEPRDKPLFDFNTPASIQKLNTDKIDSSIDVEGEHDNDNRPFSVDKSPDDLRRSSRVFHYGPTEPREKTLFDFNTPTPVTSTNQASDDSGSSSKNNSKTSESRPLSMDKSPDDLRRSSRVFHYGPTDSNLVKQPLFNHNTPVTSGPTPFDDVAMVDGSKRSRKFHYGPVDPKDKPPLFDFNTPSDGSQKNNNNDDVGQVTPTNRSEREFNYGPTDSKKITTVKPPVMHDANMIIGPDEEDTILGDVMMVDGTKYRREFHYGPIEPPRRPYYDRQEPTLAENEISAMSYKTSFITTANNVIEERRQQQVADDIIVESNDSDNSSEEPVTLQEEDQIDNDVDIEEEVDTITSKLQDPVEEKEEEEETIMNENDNSLDSPPATIDVVPTEYYKSVQSLDYLLKETNPQMSEIRVWASQIWEDLNKDDREMDLKKSMEKAKAAIRKYGPESREAKDAWLYLEWCANKISSNDDEEESEDSILTTSLLEDAATALATLDRLAECVKLEKQRLDDKQ